MASKLTKGVLRGDRSAVSRGLTLIENQGKGRSELMRSIAPLTGRAFIVGITGPPGTGKSTLVDKLVGRYRKLGVRVAVIAVDPTSPISGGALLGDRARMLRHSEDQGVFIRSMASRGALGGLSGSVCEAAQLLDAAGTDLIFIETVGIGQSDIEVVRVAHTVLVVLMPGLGDEIQMSKAGLMEIGETFVVNKSDLGGAELMASSLLGIAREMKSRQISVVTVSATRDEGTEKLMAELERVRRKLGTAQGRELRLRSARGMIIETARNALTAELNSRLRSGVPDALAKSVVEGRTTVAAAAKKLLKGS
jgi:LAO/AO transport system kinase